MHLNTKEFWNDKYEKDETGWDIGAISTPLKEYFNQLEDKSVKILVPGAGNAYEVSYLHNQGFKNVYLLDWSEKAINNFKKSNPYFEDKYLLCNDFFMLNDTFEIIVEQTFFCALPPNMREKYVEKMSSILKSNGKLVGLLFNIPLNTEQPPYGGSKDEYIKLFKENFEFKTIEKAYNSIEPRKGNELFFIAVKK